MKLRLVRRQFCEFASCCNQKRAAARPFANTCLLYTSLMATAADSRNDVLTTGAVLISTVICSLTGWARLDGIMGVTVAAFILWSGWGLVMDTLSPDVYKRQLPLCPQEGRKVHPPHDACGAGAPAGQDRFGRGAVMNGSSAKNN